MSGTNASYFAGGASAALPAPVVRLGKNFAGTPYQAAKAPLAGGNVAAIVATNIATVSVHGLPAAVMDDLATYQPQLELLRYVSVRSRSTRFSRAYLNGGYVHPSHGPGASGGGHHTHGGAHTSVPAAIQAIRPTEWAVANWGQVIDVTQGMHGLMHIEAINYRLPSLGAMVTSTLDVLVPSGATTRSFGRRFPYDGTFRPGYFRFRWSIIDPTDSRGQRVTGPLSDTVSLTNEVFPFVPAEAWFNPIDNDYNATATVDGRFKPDVSRMWVGSVSRLPR